VPDDAAAFNLMTTNRRLLDPELRGNLSDWRSQTQLTVYLRTVFVVTDCATTTHEAVFSPQMNDLCRTKRYLITTYVSLFRDKTRYFFSEMGGLVGLL
jgi:hypothetical protein